MTETKPIQPTGKPDEATKPEEKKEGGSATGTNPQASADAQAKLQKLIEAAQQMCNAPQKGQSPPQTVAKYLPILLKHMVMKGCVSRNQFIGMVATAYIETGTMAPIAEDMITATTRSFPDGGSHFRGRGWIQLTHDYNYEAAGKALGMDLLGNPDQALDPDVAGLTTLWYWTTQGAGKTCQQAAESGDFDDVRSIVNIGSPGLVHKCHSVPEFRWAIEKGLEVAPQEGIDPAVVGLTGLPANYGSTDFDPGTGGHRTLTGTHNPTSQGDALAYALGLHALDRARQLEFRATLDVAAFPKILTADIQKSMGITGFGKDLDGDYTIDSMVFYGGETLECEVVAYKPDPNAPPSQIFPGSTNTSLGQPGPVQNASATSAPAGQVVKNGDEVKLGMPYLSQLDNIYHPSGSCNATSIAMALMFLGVQKKNASEKDLGNEIFAQMEGLGHLGIPGAPPVMIEMVQRYGKKDDFDGNASDDAIKKWLSDGKPIVIHGDFTGPGHIVAVSGFNSQGFLVHDPWGKFLGSKGSYDNDASGEYNIHPYGTYVTQFWHDSGGGTWTHFIS
jgi:uncharacterized protein YvpB